MRRHLCLFLLSSTVARSLTSIHEGSLQHPFRLTDVPIDVHPLHVPRVAWSNSKGTQNLFPNEGPPQEPFQLENDDSAVLALDQAESTTKLLELHVSGPKDQRVNLMFFSDGYTSSEFEQFVNDSQRLTSEIVSHDGAMSHVADLLNVYGLFVPSNTSGIGVHDEPIPGAAFGLYRPGNELRGVFVAHPGRARRLCQYWEEKPGKGGCDAVILLGNDPLYGGLGGDYTVITSSPLNGPLILRHELGHSLIDEGDEYDGSYAYYGPNSDTPSNLGNLSWKTFLSDPDDIRIEDSRMPLQAYPWHNLTVSEYTVSFIASSKEHTTYPTILIRASISGISAPDHLEFTLNGKDVSLASGFPLDPRWEGSKDRRWIEIYLIDATHSGENTIGVTLTKQGKKQPEPQGGKILSSVEVIEYAGGGRFNDTEGFVGAFPTYDDHGRMTLRPTNENCLMRRVTHPSFCPVCASALRKALMERIERKSRRP